jgi:SulP family sulfate permease
MLHFVRRMATSVEVKEATEQELQTHDFVRSGYHQLPDDVLVFTVEGPLFFGAMENFERAIASSNSEPKHLIIRLKWVPFIDITGLQTLEEVIEDFKKRGVNVILSGANERVFRKLKKARIIDLINKKNNFKSLAEALVLVQNK